MTKPAVRAVIGDANVLAQCGCERYEITYRFSDHSSEQLRAVNSQKAHGAMSTSCDVLQHPSGWTFYSHHTHILGEQERIVAVKRICSLLAAEFPSCVSLADKAHDDHIDINAFKLHLPPMLFGADLMLLGLPGDKGALSVSAVDSLYSWVGQHSEESVGRHPLQVPKVPYAHKWMTRMAANISEVAASEPTPSHSLSSSAAALVDIQSSDWTFSNDYCCTIHTSPSRSCLDQKLLSYEPDLQSRTVLQARTLLDLQRQSVRVEVAAESGVDMDMLRRRDLPILFYDELVLFEDDLEDCGEVSFDARIRVMPTCWFLLSKFFVRIDHVVARCRETRLYHRFGDVDSDGRLRISMDVTWRELALPAVTEGGSGSLNSNVMRTKFGKQNSNDLPMVNNAVGIPQSYTLLI